MKVSPTSLRVGRWFGMCGIIPFVEFIDLGEIVLPPFNGKRVGLYPCGGEV